MVECYENIQEVNSSIVVLMLGYSRSMEVVVVGVAAFWPILLNIVSGISSIDSTTLDIAAAFRFSWLETVIKIVVPSAIPSLLLGIRVALPQVVIITLVVEMLTGAVGLGGLMMDAERNFNASGVFGLLIIVGILGVCLNGCFNRVEKLILKRWPLSGE